jgi:fluoride exporter
MNAVFLVFLGGGLGSIARYGISEMIKRNVTSHFPFATLVANGMSCIILALVVGFFNEKVGTSPALKTLLIVGFCGGFSTFSTFSFETVELIRSGNSVIAIANILISVTVCITLIYFLTKSTSL